MYIAQVHFRADAKGSVVIPDHNCTTIAPITTLLRQWWEGGQINDVPADLIYYSKRHASAVVHLPERRSLAKCHTLPRARRTLNSFAAARLLLPEVKILGETVTYTVPCCCKQPSAYILFTHAYTNVSPVRCADCFDSIPLYRLPPHPRAKLDDDRYSYEYANIHTWQRDFRRLDLTWFNSGLGERSAHSQLSRIGSKLNVDGREVREELEEQLKRNVYYFLWANTMLGDDLPEDRPCPACGEPWRLSEGNFVIFRHKCDPCRLVAM